MKFRRMTNPSLLRPQLSRWPTFKIGLPLAGRDAVRHQQVSQSFSKFGEIVGNFGENCITD